MRQRDATADDAIAGVRPRAVYEPTTLDECGEVMALAARDRLRIGFIGGGTELALGAAPTGLDAVVRTARLARIVEHAPADQVVVVEAGVTLGALQTALAAHGQRLALDPPFAERATLGGIIATAAFGPLRARHGAVRDLIIGVTLVRADGVIARGGGKVVKNVAGFDLPKIACGSLGTLGLIAGAAFRLHPLPEATTTVLVPRIRPEAVVAVLAAARAAQLEPACAVALSAGAGRFDLGVRFEGFAQGIPHQVARLLELARAADAPAEPLADIDAAAFWLRHDAVRTAGPLRARIAALPTRFASAAALVAELGELAWYPTLGVGVVAGEVELATATAAITAARAALVAEGGALVVETAPHDLRAVIDPWGPRPAAFALMQQLKQRFDPDHRLNPGRFVGGL